MCSALYTSAVNMTLPAFAAERRAAAPCCWCHMHARRVPLLLSAGASLRSTSPARGALSSKPAGVTVIGRWDRETDRRTDGRLTRRPFHIYLALRILYRQCQLIMSDLHITSGNDLLLQKSRLKYDLRKFYFISRIVDHWNILLK